MSSSSSSHNSSSSSSHSSSSSSSSGCSDCTVVIELTPQCKLEITGTGVYSIGTQQLNYTVIQDDCNCLSSVLINGSIPPVCVVDGQLIDVTTTFKKECCLCRTGPPACVVQNFAFRMTGQGLRLMISKTRLREVAMQRMQKMRARRG